ncbi:uncharacterized protein LOC134539683 isoform X2 [Bacillus rossius redtenbacheri]
MTLVGAVVWTCLLAASWRVASAGQQRRDARAAEGGVLASGLDDSDFADVLDQSEQELDENEAARLQKLASLLSVLRNTLSERQQGQQGQQGQAGSGAAEDEVQQLSGLYPGLLPLLKDEDKRGSYMSLCHFKICNMGRKRNLRWNPFLRM